MLWFKKISIKKIFFKIYENKTYIGADETTFKQHFVTFFLQLSFPIQVITHC